MMDTNTFSQFFDDYSRANWVHLVSTKSNALPQLQNFIAFVEKQRDVLVKMLDKTLA